MSVRVISWVWDHSKTTGADRLVLLAIADAANDAGRDAYPSMTTIARKAGMDKRTAQRSVRALVKLGELSISENTGPHGTNRYRVVMKGGRQDTTPRGDTPPVTDHPGETPPVASDPQGGGISSTEGRRDATRTVLNPSTTRPEGLTDTGNRNETLRAVPDTEPPPKPTRCTRHRNGNTYDVNCVACKKDREWDERLADDVRRAEADRAANCPDCGGSNWMEGEFGKPTRKCNHRRSA